MSHGGSALGQRELHVQRACGRSGPHTSYDSKEASEAKVA